MKYYSFAGPARGHSDPDEVDVVTVDEACEVDECDGDDCDHLVIMWSGGEFSRNHTWISAKENAIIDLHKVR